MSILRCFMFLVTLLGYKHNALPVCFIVAVVVVFCGDEQKETSMSISSSWLLGNDVSPQRQSLLKNENSKYKLMAELGFFFQILYEYIETHQGPSNRMGNILQVINRVSHLILGMEGKEKSFVSFTQT